MNQESPRTTAPAVLSIRELALRRTGASQLAAFTAHAREVAALSHLALLDEFEGQDDPLMLWVIHREADSRGLAPCLRWARSTSTPVLDAASPVNDGHADERQRMFVNWLADMLWLTQRDRSLRPRDTAWIDLFVATPNSADWHRHALNVFEDGMAEPESFATRLGLAKRTRSTTLTLTTPAVESQRSELKDVTDLRHRLAVYAVQHPDRSGLFSPAQVVERRLLAHRLFVLGGRQHGLAAQYQSLLTGQSVSRQAFTRQLDAIDASNKATKEMGQSDQEGRQLGLQKGVQLR